nr:RHS domain-containing protein [Klebsiella aerogenes]
MGIYHCDPNGAPVRLTSLQGEIVWSEKTGVWGEKEEIYTDRISNPLHFQVLYFAVERLSNLTYLSRGVPFLLLYIALSALFSNVSASAAS